MSTDYSGAVINGKVVNLQEYAEMEEFSNKLVEYINIYNLDTISGLDSVARIVKKSVEEKKSSDTITLYCTIVKNSIIKNTGYKAAPSVWPIAENAVQTYNRLCASCHGINGNGKGALSASLQPPPRDFTNKNLMQNISPLQAFNSIALGVEGTSMKSFSYLSDSAKWELAFYILSLQHTNNKDTKKNSTSLAISLYDLSTLSDRELLERKILVDTSLLSYYRCNSPKSQSNNFTKIAIQLLHECKGFYIKKQYEDAELCAVNAYLLGIEPLEIQIKSLHPTLKEDVERSMMNIRSAIKNKASNEVIEKEIAISIQYIEEIEDLIGTKKRSPWWVFIMSFSLLVREALEALLILLIIIQVIKSTGFTEATKWVHGGWISAVLVGIIAWFFSEKLLDFGMNRVEFFEGIVSIIAVVIVLYIGFWMHRHTEISKWKKFVDTKIKVLIQQKNFLGLGVFAFIVSGREVLECVLFLSALHVQESNQDSSMQLYAGVISAFIFIIILAVLILRYTRKLPIRQLLRVSSILLGILAVILIGKGIHSFQETGHIPIHSTCFSFRLELLGIFPTWETITVQLLIVIMVLYVLFPINKKAS